MFAGDDDRERVGKSSAPADGGLIDSVMGLVGAVSSITPDLPDAAIRAFCAEQGLEFSDIGALRVFGLITRKCIGDMVRCCARLSGQGGMDLTVDVIRATMREYGLRCDAPYLPP